MLRAQWAWRYRTSVNPRNRVRRSRPDEPQGERRGGPNGRRSHDLTATDAPSWLAAVWSSGFGWRLNFLCAVYGIWQREGEVRHLVARQLVDHTPLLQGLDAKSRSFR
jgi:hypothetical protein